MTSQELHGPHIRLRAITAADRPRLREILAEPEVARWFGMGGPDASVAELYEHAPGSSLVIEAEGTTIGWIGYAEELDPDYRHAGLDLFLTTSHQGRGLGPEALRLVAQHLVRDRRHHRLTIDPAATNERAIAAYRKAGFRPVGVMRRYERGPDGTWHDGLLMDLLGEELPDA
jgi:aminoglycoside 6'-N-acetyltransferase